MTEAASWRYRFDDEVAWGGITRLNSDHGYFDQVIEAVCFTVKLEKSQSG